MMLNLTLPLDIDFNGLASDLIGSLVGDSLKINGVSIALPYIDFHTLCCGTLEKFQSKEIRTTVHLNSAGGGDMITAVLRLAFEIVFMEENKTAVCKIIGNAIGEGKLDVYDEETLYVVLDGLYDLMETYQVPDMLLYVIYVLVTKLTPVTTDIAPRFAANGLTIKDFIASAKDPKAFIENPMTSLRAMKLPTKILSADCGRELLRSSSVLPHSSKNCLNTEQGNRRSAGKFPSAAERLNRLL